MRKVLLTRASELAFTALIVVLCGCSSANDSGTPTSPTSPTTPTDTTKPSNPSPPSNPNPPTPPTPPTSNGTTFQSLYAGDHHVCALTSAGVAYCWGKNDQGQNGNGQTNGSAAQDLVPTPVGGSLHFSALTLPAMGNHACGLTTTSASYCWGAGTDGSAGDGTSIQHDLPVPTTGGLTFQALALGNFHTCAIASGGSIYCWGQNVAGELGDSTTQAHIVPAVASTTAGKTWTSITAGYEYTCALASGGTAYCWGFGAIGQTGVGGTPSSLRVPTPVAGGLTFKTIAAGYEFTCGLTTTNAAYCWGYNPDGEVGDGSQAVRNTPSPVAGGLTFQSISVGVYHACGLTAAGIAYCWGSNASGALGDGTLNDHAQPTLVLGGLTFKAIAAGNGFTCALDANGAAYCWGSNASGEVGDGTTDGKLLPTAVQMPK